MDPINLNRPSPIDFSIVPSKYDVTQPQGSSFDVYKHLQDRGVTSNKFTDSLNWVPTTQPSSTTSVSIPNPVEPIQAPDDLVKQNIKQNIDNQYGPGDDNSTTRGNAVIDTGTRMLSGLKTFGGSVIGDAIQLASPDAANAVSKYTGGLVSPTPQSELVANRTGDWNSRINNASEAISSQVGGELVGEGISYIGKKLSPLLDNAVSSVKNRLYDIGNIKKYSSSELKAISDANKWSSDWYNSPQTTDRIENSYKYDDKAFDMLNNDKTEKAPSIKLYNSILEKNYNVIPESTHNKIENSILGIDQLDGDTRLNPGIKTLGSSYNFKVDPYSTVNDNGRQNIVNSGLGYNQTLSTAIHEGSHGVTNANSLISNQVKADMANAFGENTRDYISRYRDLDNPFLNPGATKEDLYNQYLKKPTETYARIMQIRNESGITPSTIIDNNLANTIHVNGIEGNSIVDKKFYNLISTDGLKNLLNKLPVVATPIAAYPLIKNNTIDK